MAYPPRRLQRVPPPAWAQELLTSLCARHRVRVPRLGWNLNPAGTPGWSGRAYFERQRIMVVASSVPGFDRATLIHEAAHQICWALGSGKGHSRAFYSLLFPLYVQEDVDLARAFAHEVSYQAHAYPALRASGIPLDDRLAKAVQAGLLGRAIDANERACKRAAEHLYSLTLRDPDFESAQRRYLEVVSRGVELIERRYALALSLWPEEYAPARAAAAGILFAALTPTAG